MKNGEYYFHKFNKYVERVVKVGNTIELENRIGVKSTIRQEYFNDNYIRCNSIYDYIDVLKEKFNNGRLIYNADNITVDIEDQTIVFYTYDNNLCIKVSDDIVRVLKYKGNVIKYYMKDIDAVINMLASLFE